jgi:hypothetical protein
MPENKLNEVTFTTKFFKKKKQYEVKKEVNIPVIFN